MNAELGALEQGFGVHTTKLGPGSKELAYAMSKTRAKWFVGGILSSLVILVLLVTVYASLFNDERIQRAMDMHSSMMKIGDQKIEAVRLGMALNQQHLVREHQGEDALRALNRIQNVLNARFEAFKPPGLDPALALELAKFRQELVKYVDEEVRDFQHSSKEISQDSQKTLENLAKLQEQSLRDLLKNVNGVKMEAFEDMLEDVFAAGERVLLIDISPSEMEAVEKLADNLYEGQVTLSQAREKLQSIRNGKPWPMSAFDTAVTEDEFAQALEQLSDDGKLSKGKEEIKLIADKWEAAVQEARDNEDENDSDDEDEEDDEKYDEEIKANVEALLAIHKLVAEGKVPFHLLDFEAIDMKDLQYDDDEEEEEGEGEEEGQQAAVDPTTTKEDPRARFAHSREESFGQASRNLNK